MNKGRKTGRTIALVMVTVLCLSMMVSASAAGTDTLNETEKAELSEILSDIEPMKESWGLSGVNFEDLHLGTAVQTYIYTHDTFDIGYVMYPVMEGNRIVLWAIEDNGGIQVSMSLVDEVNEKVGINDPFCIVYDRDCSYVYIDGVFVLLAASDIVDESRSSLSAGQATENVELETTVLSSTTAWEYSATSTVSSNYYYCDVKFVSQYPPSNMCWAATIACIANYKNGTSLTAIEVAQHQFGITDYDHPVYLKDVPFIMSNYGLSYTYEKTSPSDNVLLENILNDYPLYTQWDVTDSSIDHAVCLYGINVISGIVYLMDPGYGFCSATATGDSYSYVSASSGKTLTLNGAACAMW